MRLWLRRSALLLPVPAVISFALPQLERRRPEPPQLPNGKNQQEEILKAEHEKNLRDAAELIEVAGQLKEELEKNDRHIVSVSSLKKTDEIEKLAKRIRSRLRRS